MSKKNGDSSINIAIAVVAILALYLIFRGEQNSSTQKVQVKNQSSIELDKNRKTKILHSLNHNLTTTHIKRKYKGVIVDEELKNENVHIVEGYSPSTEDRLNENEYPHGVVLQGENKAEEVYKDFDDRVVRDSTPAEKIARIHERKKWIEEFESARRHAKVQDVIDRAREDGFEIEFDQELNVISIREILPGVYRNPQSIHSGDQGGKSSR